MFSFIWCPIHSTAIELIYYRDGGQQYDFVDSDGQEPKMM